MVAETNSKETDPTVNTERQAPIFIKPMQIPQFHQLPFPDSLFTRRYLQYSGQLTYQPTSLWEVGRNQNSRGN